MATANEQADFQELFKKAKNELKELGTKKKDLVIKLAQDLLKHGMIEYTICASIKKELKVLGKNVITEQYIGYVLPDNFKHKDKAHKTMNGKPIEKSNTEKALLVVGNDGRQETEKPITSQERYKELNKELAGLKIENNQLSAIANSKNPLFDTMKQNGFNPFDIRPHNYYGTAKELKPKLDKFFDEHKDEKLYILIQVKENVVRTDTKV
jgi:hypothetical protein